MNNNKEIIVKELIEAQLAINTARAELLSLKKEEEEYIGLREDKVKENIANILKESEETFDEIEKNYTELRSVVSQLKDFIKNIIKLKDNTTKQSKDLQTLIKDNNSLLEEKIERLKKVKNEIIKEKSKLLAKEEEIEIWNKKLKIEEKAIYDKRDAFERAWKDLRR